MMDEKQVLEKLDRIREIPTLPSIVLELNRLLQDPDTSVARISQTIEKDQATALKILKLVNSAFYGLQSKVGDLRSAVIMLGYNAVRNAIVSVSVIEAFASKIKLPDFDFTDFWKHSLDSPNSAGCVIDAIRCCRVALDRGVAGPLESISAYLMKHPPRQWPDDAARERVEAFLRAEIER